ncbi:MAG: hypothetical protein MO852_06805 [Candidatus Devosia euplotis]|nr:hypothetical protein [Candidatus Devosia euplotis]
MTLAMPMDTQGPSHDNIAAMSDTISENNNTMRLGDNDLPLHERVATAVKVAIAAGQFWPG